MIRFDKCDEICPITHLLDTTEGFQANGSETWALALIQSVPLDFAS